MHKSANPNEFLLIKYSDGASAGFDLGVLGDSFNGFNSVFKRLVASSGLKGTIEIKASRVEAGSVELYNLVNLVLETVPFDTAEELLEFLKIASSEFYQEAVQFFSTLDNAHRTIEDYYKERPLTTTVVGMLLGDYILGLLRRARKIKSKTSMTDKEMRDLSRKQTTVLNTMVRDSRFKKALKPVTESNVSSIKITNTRRKKSAPLTVTENNVGDFLPDKEQILPDLENGHTREFTGEVVTLQSAHGDSLKIRVDGLPKHFNLIVGLPDSGRSTRDFTEFYQQHVAFTAMVYRPNLFVRPKLVIKEMALAQEQLQIENES